VNVEDLPDFTEIFQPILTTDPYGCEGFDNQILKGMLRGCRVLDKARSHSADKKIVF